MVTTALPFWALLNTGTEWNGAELEYTGINRNMLEQGGMTLEQSRMTPAGMRRNEQESHRNVPERA